MWVTWTVFRKRRVSVTFVVNKELGLMRMHLVVLVGVGGVAQRESNGFRVDELSEQESRAVLRGEWVIGGCANSISVSRKLDVEVLDFLLAEVLLWLRRGWK